MYWSDGYVKGMLSSLNEFVDFSRSAETDCFQMIEIAMHLLAFSALGINFKNHAK